MLCLQIQLCAACLLTSLSTCKRSCVWLPALRCQNIARRLSKLCLY